MRLCVHESDDFVIGCDFQALTSSTAVVHKEIEPFLFMSEYNGGSGGGVVIVNTSSASVPTARRTKFTVKEVYYQSYPLNDIKNELKLCASS